MAGRSTCLLLLLCSAALAVHGGDEVAWEWSQELPSQHGRSPGRQLLGSLLVPEDELPPPLYGSVLDLEQLQQPGARGPCPIDRLLVTEPSPGFDGLLLTLQAGLTIGEGGGTCLSVRQACA